MAFKTFCAQICSQNSNCFSFFFNIQTYACDLHYTVYTDATPSTTSVATRYYISQEREITTTTIPTTTTAVPTTTTTVPTTTTLPTTTLPTTTVVPCPGTYVNEGDFCFQIFNTAKSWNAARLVCQSETNGDLLVIDTMSKQQFFNTYMKNNGYMNSYHFGIHHIYTNGNFVLVDGRNQATSSFTYWASGEPNNLDGPDLCGFLQWKASNTQLRWNDGSCSYADKYVCEVKTG
ncbi:hypothetical protein LOTGIDRAFT_163563 [Lottia gigantea]|uniref:C-type lectin domain-containing protein n=1 Tax=Lottia gigantea TaxID=225164 RepID=V4A7P5_LOTGI|nr:hypothetical protein LOTGIDRAFT_163563 [Lottia gigantea]ESO91045.1 hypothetical protein LOTGIDRAFT_163563 [Lottia gigantea]